jgi:hypothetical protein
MPSWSISALLEISYRPSLPTPIRGDGEKPWFVAQVHTILVAIGAATTAAMAGIEDSTIKTLGRWHSTTSLQYIRMRKARLAYLSGVMARSLCPLQTNTATHSG